MSQHFLWKLFIVPPLSHQSSRLIPCLNFHFEGIPILTEMGSDMCAGRPRGARGAFTSSRAGLTSRPARNAGSAVLTEPRC